MDNTGELRAATTKRDLSPIESTDCKLKVEPEANPQTSEVVEKPVASDRQGSPSVHTDSGTGDSGKQGQSSASSLSETKDTSGQKALESTTSSKQRNSDVSHGNTPRSKADEAHIQVSKAVSEFELDEGKDDSQEKPGAALQEATKKLHKKNSSPTESTDCEVKEEPKANLQTSKVAGKPVASDRQGSRSIHTDSGTKNNGNRGAENSGKQGSKVVQPPESSESETKDTSDLKALESTTSSEERNSDVSHGNFQRSDESHVQVSKAGSESKLEEEKDNSQGKPGPALQAATKKPHEKNSSPMKPTGCEVKEEPKANLQTSEVTDKPVASDRQGSPSVHTASGAENSGKQGSEVVQPPESPQSETKDTSDLKALESMKYSEEGNSDVSHGNTQRSEADEAHVPVSKAVLGADLPADHHDDTVPTTSSNKSEARTSGPNDKVEKPPSSRDSLVTKPESSDQNAQKLKKGTLSVDNDSDSSDEFKDALSGQEMLFDEHLRRLCSQCNKEQVVVVLHAFIDLKLWDVPYTLEDMKNLMAVRSSLGKWKENDAVGIDITKLESDDEDSVYRLKAVLVVHRSTLHEGFPYKYFLDRENSKAAECYEFVKIDGTKVFNRYVSEKNTWDETEVIHHHYDDFVLPKFPERTWFEKAQSKVKKWFKGDRSLRDSLRREALRLYLNEYCSQSLSFVSPVPLHTMKFFHLVDAICNIYRQLRDQCFCHHGSNQGTINRSDARLSDDLEEWIYSITDDHSATNVDINVETESHTMAVGLILLMVAHNSEMLAASSPKIAHLLDLCRKVPQVVACVGKIKEQVRHDVRGEYKVSAALKQLIRALTAPRKEPQCILGVLLFLSMWISDNDSCRLFDSTHCFSKDVLKQIRYAASDHQNSWINDYERCCRGSLTMFCPHLGEIALQISPLTTWPRLLPTNSLPQILEILSVRIEEEALTRAGLHEKTEALDQIITNIVQGMNQSREWDILDLEKMAHYIFLIVNSVLKGQYNWYVRTKTIRLCLCVYSRLSEDEDRLRLLVDRVTHAVSTATTYEFGYSNQALFLKFGSGYDAGFAFEINIWTNILSLCDESWLPLAPKWVELCLRKVLFRFQKLIFTDMLKALEVLQKTKKPSEALGKTLMDGIIEEFFSFPKERQELLIKGHYGSSSQFRSIMVEFLQRECPNPNKVDLGHLCTWRLWPCYFKVFGKLTSDMDEGA